MFEPGRITSSEMSSGSIPGGTKSTVRANLAAAAVEKGGGGVVELDDAVRRRRENV